MKTLSVLLAAFLSSTAFAAGPTATGNPHAGMNMSGGPHAGMPAMAAPSINLTQEGTVLSFIDHPQYTYIEVSQNKKPRWLAATKTAVKKGDVIRFDDGMIMSNFHSKSLKRTFPSIAFVNQVVVSKGKK